MGRKSSIDDLELLERLGLVFRDVGYEGATLALLAEASGLRKASLYHRFPGGKAQMAQEVLQAAEAWLSTHVLGPLSGPGSPRDRIGHMVRGIDAFYAGGKRACLLNMLATVSAGDGPFSAKIAQMFAAWIDALAAVLTEAGLPPEEVRRRAERVVIMLEGSLVLSRGIGTTRPFREFLEIVPTELLGKD
jgi:AcrR family transcriptional regulator